MPQCLSGTAAANGPIVRPPNYACMNTEQRWNDTDREKPNNRKICPSATLSTTNPTWTSLCANPGLRGEKPATNRISYATAD
jgi:hypothetical protein